MSDSRRLRISILAADLSWLVVCMTIACLLRYGAAWNTLPRATYLAFEVTLLASALLWMTLCSLIDLHGFRGGWRLPAMVSQLVLGVSTMMAILLASGYLVRMYVSRLLAGYFAILMLGGFIVIRVVAYGLVNVRHRSRAVRRVVIVGSGPIAKEVAAKIKRHPEFLCRVVGFLHARDSSLEVLGHAGSRDVASVRTCGVMDLLARHKVDELIFATSRTGNPEIADLMDQSVKRGLAVSVIPQPYELYLTTPELIDLDGLPVLRLRHTPWTSSEPFWKRVLDLALGTALLIPSVPIIVAAMVFLRIRKGKAFCQEERCGKGGKPFWMYRLNSPRRELDLPIYERIMQHLSVTELPQLLNVLRGDMSLVGPRPEVLESVRHYTDWHLQRLNVKPGITGLAQVYGLRDQNALEEKTRYDLQYILHRSLFQDISLLLQTIWTILRRLGHVPKTNKSGSVEQNASTSSIPI